MNTFIWLKSRFTCRGKAFALYRGEANVEMC